MQNADPKIALKALIEKVVVYQAKALFRNLQQRIGKAKETQMLQMMAAVTIDEKTPVLVKKE